MNIIEIIEAKKDTNALSQEELYEAIRDVYVQQVMMSENLIKEYDIQTEIEDNFLKINCIVPVKDFDIFVCKILKHFLLVLF